MDELNGPRQRGRILIATITTAVTTAITAIGCRRELVGHVPRGLDHRSSMAARRGEHRAITAWAA
jgi:hypothetical protein